MLLKPVDKLAVGDIVPSRGRTVTESDVVSFCYLTGNWLEIHSNAELAKQTRFGQRIVQGSLVFSIIPGLVGWDPRYTIAFYGVDRMRFVRPVFIGDTVTAKVRVSAIDIRDEETGIVTFGIEVENQHGQTVQALDMRILGHRRAHEAKDI